MLLNGECKPVGWRLKQFFFLGQLIEYFNQINRGVDVD